MFTPVEPKPFPKWNVLARRWFHLPFSGSDLNFPIRRVGTLARYPILPYTGSQNGEASETSLAEQHPDEGADEG